MTTVDIYAKTNPDKTTRAMIEDDDITGYDITISSKQYRIYAKRVGLVEGDGLVARIVDMDSSQDCNRGVRSIVCF